MCSLLVAAPTTVDIRAVFADMDPETLQTPVQQAAFTSSVAEEFAGNANLPSEQVLVDLVELRPVTTDIEVIFPVTYRVVSTIASCIIT